MAAAIPPQPPAAERAGSPTAPPTAMGRPDLIRIANCSGFYGDRPAAALEMVTGGPIDVLTGDWLAELTMLILAKTRTRRANGGYASTFVAQMEQVMGRCLDAGIKVVSNAGGLDPAGCAEAVADVAHRLGLSPTIAYVDGDDLIERASALVNAGDLQAFDPRVGLGDPANYLTANAYLGGFGIAEALSSEADIVITGRVTDAAVVCGPAAWFHGWSRDDFDALAGGVVAGHLIECGVQVTGGNFSFFDEIPDHLTNPRFGFPWVDIAADGSHVVGKHDGTGGAVTVDTVTTQLLYEIGGPEYLGPDVTARFDSIALEQIGPNRVRVSGVRGQAPPATIKVAMNEHGGYRNSFSLALTGLDIDAKAAFAHATFWDAYPWEEADLDVVSSSVHRTDHPDADTQSEATAIWRLVVLDRDEQKVGRAFSDALVHTVLSSIPGHYALSGGPSGSSAYGIYRPATVPAALVPQWIHLPDTAPRAVSSVAPSGPPLQLEIAAALPVPEGPEIEVPLGALIGTRSGDKGGDANIGVFARCDAAWAWIDHHLDAERLRSLLPEAAALTIERYRFPNLRALNFMLRGLLREGVAASPRHDAQAKALGEWLRSRVVSVPEAVVAAAADVGLGTRR